MTLKEVSERSIDLETGNANGWMFYLEEFYKNGQTRDYYLKRFKIETHLIDKVFSDGEGGGIVQSPFYC